MDIRERLEAVTETWTKYFVENICSNPNYEPDLKYVAKPRIIYDHTTGRFNFQMVAHHAYEDHVVFEKSDIL